MYTFVFLFEVKQKRGKRYKRIMQTHTSRNKTDNAIWWKKRIYSNLLLAGYDFKRFNTHLLWLMIAIHFWKLPLRYYSLYLFFAVQKLWFNLYIIRIISFYWVFWFLSQISFSRHIQVSTSKTVTLTNFFDIINNSLLLFDEPANVMVYTLKRNSIIQFI